MAKKRLTRKKWAKTNRDIAEFLGISVQVFHKTWQNREGFPEKTKLGWPVAKCIAFVKAAKQPELKLENGEPTEKGLLQNRELTLKCQVLEEKLAVLRGSSVSFEEHMAELQEYGAMLNIALDHFVSEVSALIKTPKAIKLSKQIRTRVRDKLTKAILSAQEKNK